MKVELKEKENLERELTIQVEPNAVKSSIDKKFEELRRNVELKGYRKGKAPMERIESLYGEQVKADVVDELIKETYPKAVRENALRVATRPTVTDLKFDDEGGLVYVATVEVFPEIEKVTYDGLKLETLETDASDEEVAEVVEAYRHRFADLRTVERAAKDDDVVTVELKKLFDSKNAVPQETIPDSDVDLANNMTVKEFKEGLPGMSAGDENEFTVRYDEDYSDPNFAGAEIKYHCRVKAVKERVLPEINDAFAKSTGQVETALELKMKIREDIKRHKAENQVRLHKRALVQQVCEQNEIPIPRGLLEEYMDSVIEDVKKQTPEVDEKQIREQYRQGGINALRWDILWHTLSEQESIEVSREDTEKWISGFASASNMTVQQAQDALRQSGKAAKLFESLLEEKVLDFLVEKATKSPAVK